MIVMMIAVIGCLSGFMLFRNKRLKSDGVGSLDEKKISVIIPARNEEENLPNLLQSLKHQTYQADEIIVVDDFSEDNTKEIAAYYGVTVVQNSELPEGWTGKTWAVWNGYVQAKGDIFVFLDADIRLEADALEKLIRKRQQKGGVISVVPYHHTEKFYERLALIANILGVFAFTSPFEKNNQNKGLYGSCIITTREDYEMVNGHFSIQSELLDDLNLGAKYVEAGIPVTNFIGHKLVKFRMYPYGLRSEIEGFSKGAILSTAKLSPYTILFIVFWIIGLLSSQAALILLFFVNGTTWIFLVFAYLIYSLQLAYFVRFVGRFTVMPIIHLVPTVFFIYVVLYSLYQLVFLGRVSWKGRHIEVGGKKGL